MNRGFFRPQRHTFCGRCCIHSRRHGSDFYNGILEHDSGPFTQRFWCRSLVVCVPQTILSCWLTMIVGPLCRFTKAKSPQPSTYVSSSSCPFAYSSDSKARRSGLHGIYRKHRRIRFISCMSFEHQIISIELTPLQWTDYFCSFIESDLSWRIPLFIQCVIGLILAVGSLALPESPRSVRRWPLLVPIYIVETGGSSTRTRIQKDCESSQTCMGVISMTPSR